jgi:hypothetical protein
VSRATISEWLDRWEAYKKAGIADAAKSGLPPTYTIAEQKKVAMAKRQPILCMEVYMTALKKHLP